MTSNYRAMEDVLNSIRPLINNVSGSLGHQLAEDLPRAISSAYQNYIDTVSHTHEGLLKNGKKIIVDRLLPYLRSYKLVAELVSLWETATQPFKEFQINAAKAEHNYRFNRIDELIEDFKTSLEILGEQTEELGTLLVDMSPSEIETTAFEKLAMRFKLQCGNVTAELGMCLKKITYLKEELKEGSASIKRLLEQSNSDSKYSVKVTGVLAVIGILLLCFIGDSYLTMAFCSAAVIAGIRSRKQKLESSEYCMFVTEKYLDYERRLPLLQDKRNNIVDCISRLEDIAIEMEKKREHMEDQEMADQEIRAQKERISNLEDEIKRLKQPRCIIL